MRISLLCPSRERPKKMFDTLENWIAKSTGHFEIIISLDESDPSRGEYYKLFENVRVKIILNENRSAIDAINNAAKTATGDVFIVVSDDTDCPDRWNAHLLKELEGKYDFIVKTQDGIQKWIITMPIMDRVYYNRFGYVYHPGYLHMFCDTELTCVADMTGRKIDIPLLFPHNHYSTGKSVKDSVSEKADKTWAQGEALFIERAKGNFGLTHFPSKVTNQEYLNWLRMKGVKA